MVIKRGIIVSHSGAAQWGAGKVVEMFPAKAAIQFSDGIIRQIAASHYAILQPADEASYAAPPERVRETKVRTPVKRVKKVKETVTEAEA